MWSVSCDAKMVKRPQRRMAALRNNLVGQFAEDQSEEEEWRVEGVSDKEEESKEESDEESDEEAESPAEVI
jgi:hypothetical protein